MGGSGRQVGRLKRQLASLGCLCALVERVGRANLSPSSVRSEFSLDVGTIAKSRKLEFRAPTQCFVRVGRSAETLTAEAKNIGENVVSVSKIEPQSVSGASREHLNHPSRAEKRQLERYRTAERFFFGNSSEQGATQSRTQPHEEPNGGCRHETRYENLRMDCTHICT